MTIRSALVGFLALLAVLSQSNSSKAGPLTGYHNQAAWEAAVADLGLRPYSGGTSGTIETTTIGFGITSVCPHSGICGFGTTSAPFGLSNNLSANFSYHNICQPTCSATSKIAINFDHEIMALRATDFSCIIGTLLLVNNSVGVGEGRPCGLQGFFGLIGPISSLEFSGTQYTDSPMALNLQNIAVFEAPEPVTVSVFGFGFACAVGLRHRRRRLNRNSHQG